MSATDRPRLLDAYCGGGGASRGYQMAGFHVTGVDNRAQPRYAGDDFIQADALEYLAEHGHEYSVIHASPPCQAFTVARVIHGNEHPDLLTPTRALLIATGKPWVIENVPGAPMRCDLLLCGTMFNLRSAAGKLRRHRWFEFWQPFFALMPSHCWQRGPTVSVFGHGGHIYHGVADWRTVMGIDWMTRSELSQAIPPAYTNFIGLHLLDLLGHS